MTNTTLIPNPNLWNAISSREWILCPVGAIPNTCRLSLEENQDFFSPIILLSPSISSNQGRGPSGENCIPKIKSTPSVDWAASASAPLGIAGQFGWVCNQCVKRPALGPLSLPNTSSVHSSGK